VIGGSQARTRCPVLSSNGLRTDRLFSMGWGDFYWAAWSNRNRPCGDLHWAGMALRRIPLKDSRCAKHETRNSLLFHVRSNSPDHEKSRQRMARRKEPDTKDRTDTAPVLPESWNKRIQRTACFGTGAIGGLLNSLHDLPDWAGWASSARIDGFGGPAMSPSGESDCTRRPQAGLCSLTATEVAPGWLPAFSCEKKKHLRRSIKIAGRDRAKKLCWAWKAAPLRDRCWVIGWIYD